MKVLRGIDGLACGAILPNRPSTLPTVAAARKPWSGNRRPQLSTKPPDAFEHTEGNSSRPCHTSSCPQTSSWLWSTFIPSSNARPPQSRRRPLRNSCRGYSHFASALAAAPSAASSQRSRPATYDSLAGRESLLAAVDENDPGTVEEHLELVRDPYLRRYPEPDGPNLRISDKPQDAFYPSQDEAVRGDPKVQEITEKMRLALSMRLRQPARVSLRSICRLYYALPEPRMLNLPARVRQRFLKALGTPKVRDSRSMLRYFSIIGEIKQCGLTLRRREWNSALAFASQYVGRTSSAEAESVLQLWNEMEKVGGAKSNDVTFNILFDAAAKSGNFRLAERIHDEMESRGFRFNRYHHVSLIHFFGLKRDGDGVRAAYKEMVDSGEIIDTVVFNCLIASFIRAGDEAAALRVYDHMKGASLKSTITPRADGYANKKMTEVLMMFAQVGREHPSMRSSLQGLASVAPDFQTYRILLDHFAWRRGNMNKVTQFLDEMKWFPVDFHGSIFLILFKAFAKHGGPRSSSWTEIQLQNVSSSLLHALDQQSSTLYIDTWLVGWGLKAFMKCAGRTAVLEFWEQMRSRWNFGSDRIVYLEQFLHRVLEGDEAGVLKRTQNNRSEGASSSDLTGTETGRV